MLLQGIGVQEIVAMALWNQACLRAGGALPNWKYYFYTIYTENCQNKAISEKQNKFRSFINKETEKVECHVFYPILLQCILEIMRWI